MNYHLENNRNEAFLKYLSPILKQPLLICRKTYDPIKLQFEKSLFHMHTCVCDVDNLVLDFVVDLGVAVEGCDGEDICVLVVEKSNEN